MGRPSPVAFTWLMAGCSVVADFGTFDGPAGRPACTGGCLMDAVDDFRTEQGDAPHAWRYLVDHRAAAGYGSLSPLEWTGDRWEQGEGIYAERCTDGLSDCAGYERTLRLPVAQAGDPERSDVVLAFEAEASGALRVEYELRTRRSAPLWFLVSRNTREDLVVREAITAGPSGSSGAATVEVLAGDLVMVRVLGAATSVSEVVDTVGLWARVFRSTRSSACMLALPFDGDDVLVDRCGGRLLLPAPSARLPVPSLSERFGTAAELVSDVRSYFDVPLPALSYAGDFTIQMWVELTAPVVDTATIYSDESHFGRRGGVFFLHGPEVVKAGVLTVNPDCTYGDNERDDVCLTVLHAPKQPVGQWRHYRIVRDAAQEVFRLCIDGAEAAERFFPGDRDPTPRIGPRIGANAPMLAPDGQADARVDDVRVFAKALPCGP